MLKNQTQQTAEDFADLLETYESVRLRRGEVVTGTIVYLEEDVAYVDVGAKQDAMVPARDLSSLENDLLENLKEGDEIQVYVIHTPGGRSGKLEVSIERGLEAADWEKAERLLASEEVEEYRVIGMNKGGLLVEFGRLRGFVPNSQINEVRRHPRRERDDIKESLIGESLLLKVIDVNRRRRRLVLSELAAKDEVRQQRMEDLEVGDVVQGRVVSLVPFGAFVDLGGVDGLVHISNLAWKDVEKPDDILKEGEEIEVEITGVDIERERISLSRKALMPNPWDEFAEKYNPGDLVEGVVESVADFGAFIRLTDAIVGLIHVSEMGDYGNRTPADVFKENDEVLVRITEIDIDRERVGLSTKRVSREEAFDWMINDLDEDEAVENSTVNENSTESTEDAQTSTELESSSAADS